MLRFLKMLDIPEKLVLRKIYQELNKETYNVTNIFDGNNICYLNKIIDSDALFDDDEFKLKLYKILYDKHNELHKDCKSTYQKQKAMLTAKLIDLQKAIDKLGAINRKAKFYKTNIVGTDNLFRRSITDNFSIINRNVKTTLGKDIVGTANIYLQYGSDYIKLTPDDLLKKESLYKKKDNANTNISIQNGSVHVDNVVKIVDKQVTSDDLNTEIQKETSGPSLKTPVNTIIMRACRLYNEKHENSFINNNNFNPPHSSLFVYDKTVTDEVMTNIIIEQILNMFLKSDTTYKKGVNEDGVKTAFKFVIKKRMDKLITKFIASEKTKEASKQLQEQIEKDIYNYLTNEASLKVLLTLVKDEDGDAIPNTGCNTGNTGNKEGLLCYREMFF